MARVGLCRLNSEGAAAVQQEYRKGRWATVAAFCNAIGITRAVYYALVRRDQWFELATIQSKLAAIGIPEADQSRLCEFRDFDTEPTPTTTPTRPNNLPIQPTSFIGRERENATLKQLLASTTLLTLTGSGGCGKTRLALQVGAESLDAYPDGVWFTEFDFLTEPKFVGQALLTTLGLREEPGRSPIETVVTSLKPKKLLLILDNCEHLVEACAHLATALLRSCSQVKILATSRESLGISGETVWRVPSLPTADASLLKTEKDFASLMMDFDACRLFVERAREHRQDLVLSRSSAIAVARLCERLDGIPLAIELAAARVRSLSVEEIEARLDPRFQLLTGGSRTALPRHQTLRALIDWSWELLGTQEKLLLARLSVFAGGWTLTAAEQVCGEKGADILDLLCRLVDKSLVLAEAQGRRTRYRLQETVREYAHDRLTEEAEGNGLRGRHRDYYLALAEEVRPNLRGQEQTRWLGVLEEEHDNLRQALTWCEEEGGEAGLRLGAALGYFWETRGHMSEGRERLRRALSHPGSQERSCARAAALHGAGVLACAQGDLATAHALHEEGLSLSREVGDKRLTAHLINDLGNVAQEQCDFATARSLYEESLTLQREIGNRWGIANSLLNLGVLANYQSDYASACSLYEQSLEIFRELGDKRSIAYCLTNLGIVACAQGNYASARSLFEESLTIQRELGNKRGVGDSLGNLGLVAFVECDYTLARSLYEKCLEIFRELWNRRGIAATLHNLGRVTSEQGDYASARSLFEESLEIRRELGDRQGIASSLESLASLALKEERANRSACL